MAAVFAILAIVFYSSSIKEADMGYNTIKVANIQGTVFAAASAIACIINLIGAAILNAMETQEEKLDTIMEKLKNSTIPTEKGEPVASVKTSRLINTSADAVKEPFQTTDNLEWNDNGDSFIIFCPRCQKRMTIDYIRARKRCPDCGLIYNKE